MVLFINASKQEQESTYLFISILRIISFRLKKHYTTKTVKQELIAFCAVRNDCLFYTLRNDCILNNSMIV